MKICAITGSSGILGKKVLQNLPFKFLIFRGDISNKKNVESWIFKNNFDLFIHFAAIVPTNIVSKNYKKAYQVNVVGTKNVIYSIMKKKIKPEWFFYASTSHVYKIKYKKEKIKENSLTKPSTEYGSTKLQGEKFVHKLKKKNIKFCIGRIFSFTDKYQKIPFLIPTLNKKINNKKNEIIKLSNLNHYRDFLPSIKIVKIIYALYLKKASGIINIGGGNFISLKGIGKLISKKYYKKIEFVDNKNKSFLIANNSKLKKYGIKFKKYNKKLSFFY